MAAVGDALGIKALPHMAYSAIWNLRYYQGVSDELQCSRQEFVQLAHKNRAKPLIETLAA